MQSDRQDQFGFYGERVLDDLLALQEHLRSVKAAMGTYRLIEVDEVCFGI